MPFQNKLPTLALLVQAISQLGGFAEKNAALYLSIVYMGCGL